MATRRHRQPAPTCVFCARPLSITGGKRITWSSAAGVVVRGYNDPVGRIPSRALLAPLPEPYAGVLIIWPANKEALDLAMEQWTSRHRPWACQGCARRVCDRCGSSEKTPMGSDIVEDDGRVLHVPILPGPAGCIREGCR